MSCPKADEDIFAILLQVDNDRIASSSSTNALTAKIHETSAVEGDADIMASLLQVDNEIFGSCSSQSIYFASEPNLASMNADKDIMTSLLQVDNSMSPSGITAQAHDVGMTSYEKSLATSKKKNVQDGERVQIVSIFGMSHDNTSNTDVASKFKGVNDDVMSSLLQNDNYKCEEASNGGASNINLHKVCAIESSNLEENQTGSEKINHRKIEVLNEGAFDATQVEISSVDVNFFIASKDNKCINGIYRLFHQCYSNLFQGNNSVRSPTRKSNAFIEKDKRLMERDQLALSLRSQTSEHSVNSTTRRRIFVPKEKQTAAAWAKRFEDPRSGLRDSLHRIRVYSTDRDNQKVRAKPSKQRLIEVS